MNPRSHLGRYRLDQEIGRGGMGVVYEGVDPELERPVAIKLILLEGAGESSAAEMEARFRREAKAAARVTHPGVVTVFDVGRHGNELFLVMELVTGGSLSGRIKSGQGFATHEALSILADVADALGAAHNAGLVHRDVKPANILFTETGQVKVTDFGVARAMGDATELTRTGMVVGSPAYMAPEQIKGEPVDPRADLFALGVILYEMLFGRKPFGADTITTLVYEILHKDPFADLDLSRPIAPDLHLFLRRALAKNAVERVPTAVAFASEARRLAAGGSVESTGVTTFMGAATHVRQPGVGSASAATPTPWAVAWGGSEPALPPLPQPMPGAGGGQTPPSGSAFGAAGVAAGAAGAAAAYQAAGGWGGSMPPSSGAVPPPPPLHLAGTATGTSPTVGSATLTTGRRRLGLVVIAVVGLWAIAGLAFWLRDVPSEPAQTGPEVPRVGDTVYPAAGTAPPDASQTAGSAPATTVEVEQVPVVIAPTPPPPSREPAPASPSAASPRVEPVATTVAAAGSGTSSAAGAAPGNTPAISPPTETVIEAPPKPAAPVFTPPPNVVATFECRQGAEFHVSPEEAEVAIDGRAIGTADDWDNAGGGQTYFFDKPGIHYARLSYEGYETVWVRIVVDPDADDKIADIDTELEKIKKPKKPKK